MSHSDTAPVVARLRGHSCRELYKSIFEADAPEQVVRQLPAQTLFMVVKYQGLAGASDLISMASLEQCRLLLDFDIWKGDSINEETLWEWLAVTDEVDSLELLQKILKFIDLKIIAVLISRYVDVQVFDEPTEQPLGPGYHSPDNGYTWLGIKTENADHHFLLARLLALIFESSAELFYQILATPGVATPSLLEEEAYQDRSRRLAAEGVPDPELAAEINEPYSWIQARHEIESAQMSSHVDNIRGIEPLVYEAHTSRYVWELVRTIKDLEQFEMEFTFIMNGATVRWGVDFYDQPLVIQLAEKVKGCINLALERLTREQGRGVLDIYQSLGLVKLYRLGLTELLALRSKARKVDLSVAEKLQASDPVLFSVLASTRESFPEMPLALQDDGTVISDQGMVQQGQRPIETFQALETLHRLLASI